MEGMLNSISSLLTNIAEGSSTFCVFLFFEPEMPKSLREE